MHELLTLCAPDRQDYNGDYQDPLWQDPINQNTSDVKKIQQKDLFSLKSVFAENINGSYQEVILIIFSKSTILYIQKSINSN